MATIEQQVKDLKKEKDYCCTQIMYQLAGLDALALDDPVAQKALARAAAGAYVLSSPAAPSPAAPWCWRSILTTRNK